jgi:tellurite resistance protein
MADQVEMLAELSAEQREQLLGALAQLARADSVLEPDERAMFADFARWLGVAEQRAQAILESESDPGRLELVDLPEQLRALVFTTGAMMALVDDQLTAEERRDLARLAGSLGIVPDSARETLLELRGQDSLRSDLRHTVAEAEPLAASRAQDRSAKRKVALVLGMFVGFGVGVFAWPVVIPGAVVGVVSGAVGGGLLGRMLVKNQRFEPEAYDFSDP